MFFKYNFRNKAKLKSSICLPEHLTSLTKFEWWEYRSIEDLNELSSEHFVDTIPLSYCSRMMAPRTTHLTEGSPQCR